MSTKTSQEIYEAMIASGLNPSTNGAVEAPEPEAIKPKERTALSTVEDTLCSKIPFTTLMNDLQDKGYSMTPYKEDAIPDFLVSVFKDTYWPTDAIAMIPKLFKGYFIPTVELAECLLGMEMGDNVLLKGPPGTGKTTLASVAASVTNRPYYRLNGNRDMETSSIFGSSTIEGGDVTWQHGPLPIIALMGGVLNCDEPFAIPADVQIGLNPVLEETPTIILNEMIGSLDDKTIVPRESFRVIYSDNTGGMGDTTGSYAGVEVQNSSTLDRFATSILVDYNNPDDEKTMIEGKFPDLQKETIARMVQVAGMVRKAYNEGGLSLTMSPRTLFSWAQKTMHYQNVHVSIKTCFLNKTSDEADHVAISGYVDTCFGKDVL
jgi:cobaltochelatase CobS